ncbi:Tat pathway signal protein, partial [Candidatus Thioglobus sp.]|nr:Tat pathway signal protein [Candidatus Thioglobus sp.]
WGFNPASDYSTSEERTEITIGTSGSVSDSGYGEVELEATKYWPSDSNYSTEKTDLEVEKAFLQFSFDDWSTKIGKYTIGWGELEGGALDVVNPYGGLTDPSMIPQWFMSATGYFDKSDLSFFYNSNPEISKSKLLVLKNDTYDEFGVRYGMSSEGSDMAFYLGELVPNDALINLTDGVVYATPYQLLGFGMNKAFDDFLLKFDVAYKNNIQHNRIGQFIKVDRLDWSLAFDVQNNDRQWLISINSQYLMDYESDYLTPSILGVGVSTKRNNMSYMLSVSDKFGDSDWKWGLSNVISSNNDLNQSSATLEWDINDQWQASFSGTYIDAKDDRAFASLDDYQSVNLEIKYQY